MKQIKYLSIQGNHAPSFWFKHQDAHSFRSLVESLTLSSSLIVSSIYRSDLFYYTEEDKSDMIIQTWCSLKGRPYDEHTKNKFIRGTDKQEAFEFYFDTLFHLMLHSPHYGRYKERLNEIQRQEPNNKILLELMQCDIHLADCYRRQHVHYTRLMEAVSRPEDKVSPEGFKALAKKKIKFLNYN